MILIAHGGVGSPRDKSEKVEKAVERGYEDGMSFFEAVVSVVAELENDPYFNAGKGSRLRLDGSIQMDAAVQSQEDIGAVAAVEDIANPVRAAEIIHDSPYLVVAGDEATELAKNHGLKERDLKTEKREEELEEMREKLGEEEDLTETKKFYDKIKGGTVGCVAYEEGKTAAAVSTGGASYSIRGRVGDSPLIGSGFYVGKNGAVVATGKGEEIIRQLSSKRCHDLIEEHGLEVACEKTIEEFPEEHSLGLIAVNSEGESSANNREMAQAVLRTDK
ncbi:MAG: isoaspartyl peptidase/L-asparaginase [Candidatus Thermoplasmatota archaeon]|nr:isoaspartyl peptidase/L-asparaginase [Candidatus Thermoplasmatota archaeon]